MQYPVLAVAAAGLLVAMVAVPLRAQTIADSKVATVRAADLVEAQAVLGMGLLQRPV